MWRVEVEEEGARKVDEANKEEDVLLVTVKTVEGVALKDTADLPNKVENWREEEDDVDNTTLREARWLLEVNISCDK